MVEDLMKTHEEKLPHGYFCLAYLYKKVGNKALALKNVDNYAALPKKQGKEEDRRVDQLRKKSKKCKVK